MATSRDADRKLRSSRKRSPERKPTPDRKTTSVAKHSLLIAGHPTSISLEDAFWARLKLRAETRGQSVAALVASIDADRGGANLSSAIRVYLLEAAERSPEPGVPPVSAEAR